MFSPIQHSQNFDAVASSIHVQQEQKFEWNKKLTNIFNSACLAIIYLNGGQVELKKERATKGNQKSALSVKAIEHILQRGNFSELKTVPTSVLHGHLSHLREKSKKRGSTLEEELMEQYQDLQAKTIVNDKGEKTSLLLEELNKFGIQPGEYDQWLSINSSFKWDKEREKIFNSACFALIYLNGGSLELKKERASNGNQKSALSYQAIENILQKGNFPEFTTLPKRAVEYHFADLRKKSKRKGSTLEEELLKQYQDLQAKTIVNDVGEEIPALLVELNKFGIQPGEYDQWLSIESFFTWDKEKEAIFHSACLALIYLNGGNLELKKERVVHWKLKSALFPQAIEHILQRGNFPEFTACSKKVLEGHLNYLREKSKKRGSTLEQELLEQYQDLQAKTIVNDKGETTSLLLQELNKFGIQPGEYDQWISIESCFKWDEERGEIFTSACLTLLYLNGGQLELPQERTIGKRARNALSLPAIEHILQRGNFPEFKNLSKMAIQNNLKWLKNMAKKNGFTWEEEILNQYQELEKMTLFNDAGEEIPAIWKEVEKFGVKPDDYDSWLVMEPTKQNPRKRVADEPADPEAEPEQKRPNNAN